MVAAPVTTLAGGLGALFFPSQAGGSLQTHGINGTTLTVQFNGDMTTGQVFDNNGNPTGIFVTGIYSNGGFTGFTPASNQDALGLGALTGTDISTGSVLDITVNNESTNTDITPEEGNEGSEGIETTPIPDLPTTPEDLLKQGFIETSHPEATANGHRTFVNEDTGLTIRFDEGEAGQDGHAANDHYHVVNPNSTGKHDQYLDENGNPVPKGSAASHIYPD